ncbi:MAG: GerMN domain-containing protein [Treponema sp.]|jgi:hypothetical protein|nr:GerMN domain-containing protein [Treponema sp.]
MSLKNSLFFILRFFKAKGRRRLTFLILIGLFALGDFLLMGLVRRTFVFYFVSDRSIIVEDRMLRRSESRESDITRYVEEFLLGPGSPDLAPLFPRETRLRSLLYRDGVVYADLSESAALPFSEQGPGDLGQGLAGSFETLYRGIRRNFPYVRDVRLFVAGNAAFSGEFGEKEAPGP